MEKNEQDWEGATSCRGLTGEKTGSRAPSHFHLGQTGLCRGEPSARFRACSRRQPLDAPVGRAPPRLVGFLADAGPTRKHAPFRSQNSGRTSGIRTVTTHAFAADLHCRAAGRSGPRACADSACSYCPLLACIPVRLRLPRRILPGSLTCLLVPSPFPRPFRRASPIEGHRHPFTSHRDNTHPGIDVHDIDGCPRLTAPADRPLPGPRTRHALWTPLLDRPARPSQQSRCSRATRALPFDGSLFLCVFRLCLLALLPAASIPQATTGRTRSRRPASGHAPPAHLLMP